MQRCQIEPHIGELFALDWETCKGERGVQLRRRDEHRRIARDAGAFSVVREVEGVGEGDQIGKCEAVRGLGIYNRIFFFLPSLLISWLGKIM